MLQFRTSSAWAAGRDRAKCGREEERCDPPEIADELGGGDTVGEVILGCERGGDDTEGSSMARLVVPDPRNVTRSSSLSASSTSRR